MTLIGERYQLVEKLGQGGMGDVYRGLDTRTQIPVAIKNLRDSINTDTDVLERFRREGAALRELNHPNIVKMLDMIQHEDAYYLIMEYIEGGDLANLLKARGKLPMKEAVKLALELADALSRAHHLGIVHRDIKPANVLIARDGTPRLTDFGVARIEAEERLTGTGVMVGTMDYMPPEAVNGEPVDARGDIWAFGVMLYEMLTGERPFTGETTLSLLHNILTLPVPDVTVRCPDAPPALKELIEQMLQNDRETRLGSARQVGAALEAILQGKPVNLQRLETPSKPGHSQVVTALDVPTDVRPTPLSSKRRLPVWLLPIAALLIVIIGAALAASGILRPAAPTATPQPTLTVSTPAPTLAAASTVLPNSVPEGWRVVQGDGFSLALPQAWMAVPASTELIKSTSALLFNNADFAEQVESLVQQFDPQLAFGQIAAEAPIAGGVLTTDKSAETISVEIQMDFYESLLLTMMPTTGVEIKSRSNITLPAGAARRLDASWSDSQSQNGFSLTLVIIGASDRFYILSFATGILFYDALAPTFDQIIESFTVAP